MNRVSFATLMLSVIALVVSVSHIVPGKESELPPPPIQVLAPGQTLSGQPLPLEPGKASGTESPMNNVGNGRFQISAFAYPGSDRNSAVHGAYAIDTQTGAVWEIREGNAPRKVGDLK